jgi:hypothetical protein
MSTGAHTYVRNTNFCFLEEELIYVAPVNMADMNWGGFAVMIYSPPLLVNRSVSGLI